MQTIVAGKCYHKKKLDAKKKAAHTPTPVGHLHGEVGVPDFWRTVVTHNLILQDYIKDKDFKLLDYITLLRADKIFDYPM